MSRLIRRSKGEGEWSDFFAGAGGSSTGIKQAGCRVRVAANHWQLAVDVHQANHTTTDHAAVDLHLERPQYFPRTQCAWFSPECTKWSQAGGNQDRPAIEEGLFEDPNASDCATRSRLLMFDVLRYVEYHQYDLVVVENVVNIATDQKYALAWAEWKRQFRNLGYHLQVLSVNAMHAQLRGLPAPQSRDRLLIVATRNGLPIPDMQPALRPPAYCPRCDTIIEAQQSWKNGRTVGKYRTQYLYVHGPCGTVVEPGWLPAAAAVDWTVPGTPVGDRLAPKTRARIAAGIARYWGPFTLEAAGHTFERHPGVRTWPATDPLMTLHTSASKALAVPMEGRDGKDARTLMETLRTQTTRQETGLALPPFQVELYGTSSTRPITEPAGTFTAGGNHHALVTTAGGSWNDDARPAIEAMRTLTTRESYALIHRHNSSRGSGAEMTTPAFEALRTLTTAGHQSLLTTGTRTGRPRIYPEDLAAAEKLVPEVLFRMLMPSEMAAGQGFPDDYLWDVPNAKGRLPSNRDKARLTGNAVPPPMSRDVVSVAVEGMAA